MNKKYILFIICIVLIAFLGMSVIGILTNDENKGLMCFYIGFAVFCFIGVIIVLAILMIFFPPEFANSNPEEDDLKVYALKNARYHSMFRKIAVHPLGNTGSVAKQNSSRFGLSGKIKKTLMIALLVVLIVVPTLIVFFTWNMLDKYEEMKYSLIIMLYFPVFWFVLFAVLPKKKGSNALALDAKSNLLDLIEKDKTIELMDKRIYEGKTYLEIKIDSARGYFEISKTSVLAFVLGEKELEIRDSANQKDFTDGIITSNEINEQLDGAIVLAKKYKKTITAFNDREAINAIKNIINEYINRKPSLFDRLNQEIKR